MEHVLYAPLYLFLLHVHKIHCIAIVRQNISKNLDQYNKVTFTCTNLIDRNSHSFQMFPLLPTIKPIIGSNCVPLNSSVLYKILWKSTWFSEEFKLFGHSGAFDKMLLFCRQNELLPERTKQTLMN